MNNINLREKYDKARGNSTRSHEIRKLENKVLSLEIKKKVMTGIIIIQSCVILALGGYAKLSTDRIIQQNAVEQEALESETQAQAYYDNIVDSLLKKYGKISGKDSSFQDITVYNYQGLAESVLSRIEENQLDDRDILLSKIAKKTDDLHQVGHDVVEKMLPYMGYESMNMEDYCKMRGYMNEKQFHDAMNDQAEWYYRQLMEQENERGPKL